MKKKASLVCQPQEQAIRSLVKEARYKNYEDVWYGELFVNQY